MSHALTTASPAVAHRQRTTPATTSIAPGATWDSEFEVVQRALMAWYHPHQMHSTGRQVYMGIAGLISPMAVAEDISTMNAPAGPPI